ncbi:ferrochelatase [Bacteroidota bacterium]
MIKTAVLLINIGTPKGPDPKNVGIFLKEFLNDGHVIEIPELLRNVLVNLIIVPFRKRKSSKLYQKLWTEKGSPLLIYSQNVQEKLNKKLPENYSVYIGMRYGQPSIKAAIDEIKTKGINKTIVFPLFPQYAYSTTASAIDHVNELKNKLELNFEIRYIEQFYNNPGFIKNYTQRIKKYELYEFDHIIFSYHGLPLKQVYRSHANQACEKFNCKNEIGKINSHCYYATCYETTRLISKELGLSNQQFSVGFQSRFAKKWLSPFTDELIINQAKKGAKKLLIVCPSFVADCLETIVEIDIDHQELFMEYGGQKIQLVESLNDNDDWIETLSSIILDK